MESEKAAIDYVKPKEIMTYIINRLFKIYMYQLLKFSENSYDKFIQNIYSISLNDIEYFNELAYCENKMTLIIRDVYFDPMPLKDKEYEIYSANGFTNGKIFN